MQFSSINFLHLEQPLSSELLHFALLVPYLASTLAVGSRIVFCVALVRTILFPCIYFKLWSSSLELVSAEEYFVLFASLNGNLPVRLELEVLPEAPWHDITRFVETQNCTVEFRLVHRFHFILNQASFLVLLRKWLLFYDSFILAI